MLESGSTYISTISMIDVEVAIFILIIIPYRYRILKKNHPVNGRDLTALPSLAAITCSSASLIAYRLPVTYTLQSDTIGLHHVWSNQPLAQLSLASTAVQKHNFPTLKLCNHNLYLHI